MKNITISSDAVFEEQLQMAERYMVELYPWMRGVSRSFLIRSCVAFFLDTCENSRDCDEGGCII